MRSFQQDIRKTLTQYALIPVLGVVFAALLLGEALKWQYFVAMFMVASGIFVTNR